ncbi:hypothetical protein CsSME_00024442 [Camellia sinensis var. sinensis]
MVQYSWFYNNFYGSQLTTQEQVEQYTRGFLIYLLGTTLFANRWNTVGLYLLSALVVYTSFGSRKKGNKVGCYWRAWQLWAHAYFPTLAPIPKDECYPRCHTITTFAYYRHFFDIVMTHEVIETHTHFYSMSIALAHTLTTDFNSLGDYACWDKRRLRRFLGDLLVEDFAGGLFSQDLVFRGALCAPDSGPCRPYCSCSPFFIYEDCRQSPCRGYCDIHGRAGQ